MQSLQGAGSACRTGVLSSPSPSANLVGRSRHGAGTGFERAPPSPLRRRALLVSVLRRGRGALATFAMAPPDCSTCNGACPSMAGNRAYWLRAGGAFHVYFFYVRPGVAEFVGDWISSLGGITLTVIGTRDRGGGLRLAVVAVHSAQLGRRRRKTVVAVGLGPRRADSGPRTAKPVIQAELLRGGLHFGLWRWQYRLHKVPLVTIRQGRIGYVYARDGESLPPSQTLGRIVECNNFQDARAFLGNGASHVART